MGFHTAGQRNLEAEKQTSSSFPLRRCIFSMNNIGKFSAQINILHYLWSCSMRTVN